MTGNTKVSKSKELSIYSMIAKTSEMAMETFKFMLCLKQDTESFYYTVRNDFQKRLRITYFADDGSGQMIYKIKYRHWYYIPYYLVFRDRKRILGECAIIIAEEYIFRLTKRNIRKGSTNFLKEFNSGN